MGPLVGFAHPLAADVSVDLRAGQTAVPQEFMHATHVGPPIKQVRSKRVSQCVWACRRSYTCLFQVLQQNARDTTRAQPAAKVIEKERGTRYRATTLN